MMNALVKFLFGRARSSPNLFLVMPVLALMSVCCLCPGGKEPQTCITSDGSTLVWAGSDLLNISLADGSVKSAEKGAYDRVLCLENNEVITFREKTAYKNNATRYERTAGWRNAAKSYRLADIESFQKTIGVIDNRYFVSSSRGFIERTRSSGKSTVRYNVYNQPQIFSLEDSTSGELKSHYLHRDKLGLPETRRYEDLWFYPLSLDKNGSLLFGMKVDGESSVGFFKINMFDGGVTRAGAQFSMPKEMRSLKTVAADSSGKYIAFVYELTADKSYPTVIDVFNFETGQTVISKSVGGISFINNSPRLIFEENGARLAIIVEGLRYEPSESVRDITIFDLATGREVSKIDAIDFFKQPEKVGVLQLTGDDLLLTYSPKEKPFRDKENHLCKLDVLTKQIVWDVRLPQ